MSFNIFTGSQERLDPGNKVLGGEETVPRKFWLGLRISQEAVVLGTRSWAGPALKRKALGELAPGSEFLGKSC